VSKPAPVYSVAATRPKIEALLTALAPDAAPADVGRFAVALAWRCRLASVADPAAQQTDRSKHPHRQARMVAEGCANAYQGLTGRRPTVSTSARAGEEGRAYGAFLDLVRDVFAELQIEAKPERFARDAAAARRP
jgi:hypothetical protein